VAIAVITDDDGEGRHAPRALPAGDGLVLGAAGVPTGDGSL